MVVVAVAVFAVLFVAFAILPTYIRNRHERK
jgi:hypothetical protein